MNIVFEKQVVKWLMDATERTLDPDQFGGRKGNSISSYTNKISKTHSLHLQLSLTISKGSTDASIQSFLRSFQNITQFQAGC